MKKFFVLLIFLFSAFMLSCSNGKQPTQQPPDTVVVYRDSIVYVEKAEIVTLKDFKAKNLYSVNCKFCHGNSGKGDGIKARTDSTICPYDLTKETKPDTVVYYVILKGADHMPPHGQKLSDENIKVLVIHIKKFRK